MTAASRRVTLYRKAGCGLCDEAADLLGALAAPLAFSVDHVDIDSDTQLARRYRWAIPVVAVGENEVARAPIRAAKLEDALRAALV